MHSPVSDDGANQKNRSVENLNTIRRHEMEERSSPPINTTPKVETIPNSLKQRIITALTLVAVFLGALVLLSPRWFSVFIGLVVLGAAWEWANLAGFYRRVTRFGYVGLTAGLLLVAGYYLPQSGRDAQVQFLAGACVWWAIALLWVQGFPSSAVLWGGKWVKALMGCFVLVPTWVAFSVLLMDSSAGVLVVLFVVAIVVLMDTGGFVAGKIFGHRKLAPQVSPGKTWAGFLGGLALNALLIMAVGLLLKADVRLWSILAGVVLATACASVLGDLVESMVKRQRQVKDSSSLLPGHGGILDRVDGMTAAFPVFTLLYLLFTR